MNINQPITDKSSNKAHADLLLEIEQTPEEYLPELVQIVRLFRQTVTMKHAALNDWEQAINEINDSDVIKQQQRKENIKQLFDSWNDLDEQQEQQETLEIIESMKGISI